MNKLLLSLTLSLVLLAACRKPAEEMAPVATYNGADYAVYGDSLSREGAIPADTVASNPDMYAGQTIKVAGTIKQVCQVAGCWATIDAGNGRYVRVVLPEDEKGEHTFVLPKDISGRRAVAMGTLVKKEMSREEQEHMANDAGKEHQPADAAASEIRLKANGVLVESV